MKSRRFLFPSAVETPVLCLIALMALSLLPGCTPPKSGVKSTTSLNDVLAQESQESQALKRINSQILASGNTSAANPKDYVLGEGDLLDVSVFESQDLKVSARIGARGFITLPLLGPVELANLTTSDAERKVEDLYRAKYLHDPHVNIFVRENVSGKITLMGCVKQPGTYDYLATRRLLDVLALAQGLSDKAGRMVQVRRQSDDPDRPATLVVDLDELTKQGQDELNVPIRRGDVIYVPEAGMVYVDGAVRKAGNYPITQAMSIQEAIVTAGGFSKIADQGDIKLVRIGPDGKRAITTFAIKDVTEGNARTYAVKDRDIIYVETNTLKALLYGFKFSVLGTGGGFEPPSSSQ